MKLIVCIMLMISFLNYGQTNNSLDSVTLKSKIIKAKQIDLDQLLSFWILNTKTDVKMPRLREFYVDSSFTYFIRSGKSYKIPRAEIHKINYENVNGDSLRKYFFYNIIPLSDRNKSESCDTSITTPTFKCKYITSELIEISCHYKIICNLTPVLNKIYLSNYNLKNKTFEKGLMDVKLKNIDTIN